MKRSLIVLLALSTVALSAQAQDAPVADSNQKIEIKNKVEINAADRAEVAKGAKEVARGMQGFFQALNDAVAKAHANRAAAEAAGAEAVKSSSAEAKPAGSKSKLPR